MKAQLEEKELKVCVQCSTNYAKWTLWEECEECNQPIQYLDEEEVYCIDGKHLCGECKKKETK